MHTNFVLIAMVTIAAFTDLRSRRIPNVLVAAGLAAALMLHVFLPGGSPKAWLFGMLVGFALFLPFYLVRGMAAGDVKLMTAVGAFVGPQMALQIALATFLIGGIWALAMILFKGKLRIAWTNLRAITAPLFMRALGMQASATAMPHESVGHMPYGVAIALGTVASVLW